ncbi:glycosyltransferase family protein [Paenibacillus cucumis (ex Kampfer et al. 2016)]|uniref:Glycosyltransferase n=1 Tax=Paenibacillus cucumis (ex Kampfer et al. 2016) TaxID=1776858 RepID=A0ABS7KRK7_9BACL|nr:glycosyltransferase [Paenibacillus cucumis (ex Kampfer et al. 2016)]MBY0206799.1 glycosyltransferase [Paenibacillus cucumis (ex Kampfer et al. 2016)]
MSLTRVVSFCLGDIPSAKVGIVELMKELQNQGLILSDFYLTGQLTKEIIAEADIIISIRSADSYELEIVKECKRLGKMLIYYTDDDLLNIPQYAESTEYFNSGLIKKNIISIMNECDYLLTNNILLKEKYEQYVQKGAFVINAPALLIDQVIPGTCHQVDTKPIKIGFSGGTDHKKNLEQLLSEPLKRIKDKYKDKVQLEIMGAKPDLGNLSYTHISYMSNYDRYIEKMRSIQWDIALAPLPSSDFHSCKYFNKYLEYGAICAAGIYSDVQPYKQIVKSGINGILTENTTEGWETALISLIENTVLRNEIQRKARYELEQEFNKSYIANDLRKKMEFITSYKAPSCNYRHVKISVGKQELIRSKLGNVFSSMGMKAPYYILKKVIIKIKKK